MSALNEGALDLQHDVSQEQTVSSTKISVMEREIENRIRALQLSRHRWMFSDLAEALPDATWQRLFSALSQLSKQKHVLLVAHRWDYEVIFLNKAPTEHKPSGSARSSERCEHDERAQV
jgi:hypothetical protein